MCLVVAFGAIVAIVSGLVVCHRMAAKSRPLCVASCSLADGHVGNFAFCADVLCMFLLRCDRLAPFLRTSRLFMQRLVFFRSMPGLIFAKWLFWRMRARNFGISWFCIFSVYFS